MYLASVLLASLLSMVSALYYSHRAWTRKSQPALATWISMLLATILAFVMYWTDNPTRSWGGNVGLTMGLINVATIFVVVLAAALRDHGSVRFSTFQKYSLCASALLGCYWFVTREALIAYCYIQAILLIAYVVTVQQMWVKASTNETYTFWLMTFGVNCGAVYPALVMRDQFAMIYIARALPSTIGMLLCIRHVRRRATTP